MWFPCAEDHTAYKPMLFNSFTFIFAFLPVVVIGYFVLHRRGFSDLRLVSTFSVPMTRPMRFANIQTAFTPETWHRSGCF